MKRVLFVCVENAGRSQMAEAFANFYGKNKIVAQSAGVKIADRVNPVVVEVMKEKGFDISNNTPKLLTASMAQQADFVFTMGCGVSDVCPVVLFKQAVDWNLDDPKGQPIEKVRIIRDQIEQKVKQVISQFFV